ncbi:hypothetical protein BP6252_09485 [Coleophoma cylindrospora]|uniref:WSC domain-containing protein n=1 Tax=Coleophoma cylindrospora TaxID=1849047 RepID=A0A3D8R227_9HELO|nr:hypothetical protein BP6252_09485 [Coleophoma cylindrospora]
MCTKSREQQILTSTRRMRACNRLSVQAAQYKVPLPRIYPHALANEDPILADKSAYWTPQLYYRHASGVYEEVPNSGMAVYYLGRGIGADGSSAVPFPEGLRMLSGNNLARHYDSTTMTWGNKTYPPRPVADRVSFACIDYSHAIPQSTGMVNTTCPDGMRAQIQMQSCWDGKNLYAPDQSHVAYLSQIDNGACPPTHPVLLPHTFFEVMYSVDRFSPATDGGAFVFANGDESGYGFHGDFLNGWDTPTLQSAIKTCLAGTGSGSNTPGDGAVEHCPAFQATNNDDTTSLCPERSPVYPCEKVHGTIGTSLPGCITPTGAGPDSSSALTTCPGGNAVACSASYDTHGPATFPGNDQYQLLGCYTEATGRRALSDKSYSNKTNTVEQCLAFCAGSLYAGVEWGQECYCGGTLNAGAIQVNSTQCAMTCSANQYQICGGSSRLNVYKLKNPTSSSSLSSTAQILPTSLIIPNARVVAPTTSSSSRLTTVTSSTRAISQLTSTSPSSTSSSTAIAVAKPTTGPVIVPGNANYTYYACVNEPTNSRALAIKIPTTTPPTVEACLLAAQAYPYVGLEYGGECWADTTLEATNASTSDCKMTCSGNTTQICGGASRLTVYHRRNSTTPKPSANSAAARGFAAIGCVAEPLNGRLLATQLAARDNMTVEACMGLVQEANTVAGKGYGYLGLEYGRECWAGVRNASAIVLATGCNMLCGGDGAEWCGGRARLNLYQRLQG